MTSTAVRRFLTEDGWSDWMDLTDVLVHPAPGSLALYDGLPILKQETKPSKRSGLAFTTTVDPAPLTTATATATESMKKAMADISQAFEEQVKEKMLEAFGIGLNAEEPGTLTATMIREKIKEYGLEMDRVAKRTRLHQERRRAEDAYKDNDDYGQF